MKLSISSLADWHAAQETVTRRRYGVIEVRDGRLTSLSFRPWPALVSAAYVGSIGGWQHTHLHRNRCLLYYNQPRRHRQFLALKYVVTTAGTTLLTFRRALVVLDEIARWKKTDAIVCEVTNRRISHRLLEREGWERHVPRSRRRHYIKRFYGSYLPTDIVAEMFADGSTAPGATTDVGLVTAAPASHEAGSRPVIGLCLPPLGDPAITASTPETLI